MEPLTLQTARCNRPIAGGLLVLTSALLFAGVGAIVKVAAADLPIEVVVFFRMTVTEPVARIVFYFTTFGTLVSAVPLVWAWKTPEGHLLWALCGMGILAIMAQMCLTKGYSLAPAGQVGPFNYGNVVFAALLGWMIWGETLDGLTLAGSVLTCSAGIIATYHSERHI
jgi:drug/metabolite transporter (DMT)-like permease